MKPLILITNDDGVFSPGLQAAAQAAAPLGELLIVAPRYQQTGMSRALPYDPQGGIIESVSLQINGQPHPAYGVHTSPALTVIHALLELAPRRPDLCISGINYGDNIGAILSASGTLGAAFEASGNGIPALAVSRDAALHTHYADAYAVLDWEIPTFFTRRIAERILQNGMPVGADVLNLNIPQSADQHTEIRATRQSRQPFYYYTKPDPRDFAQPFRLSAKPSADPATLEPDSDIQAYFFDRVVSLTPLKNNLTADANLSQWI